MHRLLILALTVVGVCGCGHHSHGFGGWGLFSGLDSSDSSSDSSDSSSDSSDSSSDSSDSSSDSSDSSSSSDCVDSHQGHQTSFPFHGSSIHFGTPAPSPGQKPQTPDFGHHFYFDHGQFGKFESSAWFVIQTDRNLQNVCKASTNSVREIYENSGYRLVYSLQGYDKKSFAVKTKHRVLSLTAQKLAPSTSIFEDVRIIPNIAKGAGASWVYANDKFDVFFLYKKPLNMQSDATCDEIDETIVDINEFVLPFEYRQTDLSKTRTIPLDAFDDNFGISQNVV